VAAGLGNNGGRMYSFGAQPVLIDCNFVVDNTNGNGLGIRSLKGQGVENVFMHTTASPGKGPNGLVNPNPAAGYALIQLQANYNRFLGCYGGAISPTTGSNLAITSSAAALTVGQPYIITSPGHSASGQATISPVADVSGSLASTYFVVYDSYGNTWVMWLSVSGVGARPQLGNAAPDGTAGLHYVQVSILQNATAAQIGAALVLILENLPSGIAGVDSFTATGTTTVTIVNTRTSEPYKLPGVPQDGVIPTGFTFALTVNDSARADWIAVGLPAGVTAAIGAAFTATSTGSGSSTGTVMAVGASDVMQIEVVGDPNASIAPVPQGGSPHVGGWILVRFLGLPSSGQVPLVTQPAQNTVIGLTFEVDARFSPSNVGF
jgi:hypothetical protein